MTVPSFLQPHPEGTLLEVHLQPRASRDEIVGVQEAALKVRLTAPPVEGEANKRCIELFAKLLRVPKSRIDILRGARSRHKTLLIRGIDPATVAAALGAWGRP